MVEEDGGTGAAAWIVLCRRAVAGWMGDVGTCRGPPTAVQEQFGGLVPDS